jgi:hypothetical protein
LRSAPPAVFSRPLSAVLFFLSARLVALRCCQSGCVPPLPRRLHIAFFCSSLHIPYSNTLLLPQCVNTKHAFQQLFGVNYGLAMGMVTFDWSQITYIGSPLATPWWAEANIAVGFVFFFWILTPALYVRLLYVLSLPFALVFVPPLGVQVYSPYVGFPHGE